MDFLNHLGAEIEKQFEDANSSVKIIKGRMTHLLQFLRTNPNNLFKDVLKEKWEDWIENGEAEYTEGGNRMRASYQVVAEWADDAWKKDALIMEGFRHCMTL